MNEFTARAGSLPLVGSELAFDLANTASGRGSPKNLEHFHTPTDVIVWARHAKVITGRDRDAALERIADDPALGRRLLRQVLSSREVIHRIGVAISHGSQPAPADLSALRAIAHPHACSRKPNAFRRRFRLELECRRRRDRSDTRSHYVVRPDIAQLNRIFRASSNAQGEHCGWLFFDTTKNKSRRWCEMEVCGNRAKQKQFAERRRSKENRRRRINPEPEGV